MNHRHFLLHKPWGYLSQFISDNKKKKCLGELFDFPAGTMAIGRLDEESEGLLLLTTDGKMSELIRSRSIEKEYYVQVDGDITEEALQQLQAGVEIVTRSETYRTHPAKARKLIPAPELPPRIRKIRDDRHGPTSWVSITISEGKYRQVRKMTAVVGFPTLRLVRVRVGEMLLEGLASGGVQEVTGFETKP